jgi:hypothetical protein
MLVSRQCLSDVGPFDEKAFAIAFNDVDFCLRAGQRGYRIVWTPFATLLHHESATRGSDELPQNRERFAGEKQRLIRNHGTNLYVDPAFSPWYTLTHSDPRIRLLSSLPAARLGGLPSIPRASGPSEDGTRVSKMRRDHRA